MKKSNGLFDNLKFIDIPDDVKIARHGKFEEVVNLVAALKDAPAEKATSLPEMQVLKTFALKDISGFVTAVRARAKKLNIRVGISVRHGSVWLWRRNNK